MAFASASLTRTLRWRFSNAAPWKSLRAAQQPLRKSLASAQARKEDWWLVRAKTSEKDSVSGWILGRFIELDVPQPLPDYASSAGMRIVSWSELNQVVDASGKSRPQYLLLGAHGPEGQPCDFSMLRVYTWGKQRQRYETAYVESGVCGKLPVDVKNSRHPATRDFRSPTSAMARQLSATT